ncbi:MAG TPA: ATP-binding protein, partial [Baekduia sp.]|nr:ATP-binding protein [Baekduia sp.]
RVAGGDLETRIEPQGPEELREVASAFNAMAGELELARQRLDAERRRLATTVQSLGDGLIMVGADGAVTMCNPRACQLVSDLRPGVAPAVVGLALPPVDQALREELLIQHGERTLALTAAVLEDGEPGVVWTMRDATERARLERLKSEFVATASHELRSPLTSIKGFVELLAASPDLTPRHREFVDIIQLSTNRLVDLVNDLLDVARLEAGAVEVHRRPTDLTEVVDEVTRLLRPRLTDKRQDLHVEIAPDVPRALADPSRMRQVLTNLLTNAHLYTPEAGEVTVRLRATDDTVVLEVADTGRGMSAEELEHVFDRFARGAAEHGRTRGTGLGLSIVRSLVDLHDGRIDVDSTPGQGTTFRVGLQRAAPAGPGDARREALRGRRVLVVDDEPETAALIAQRLAPFGVETEIEHRGDVALARLRRERFDAVTVDILMPGMSGFEVLRAMRSDPALAGTPAVVVSVFSGREALSGEWVVSKPIDAEELADALGSAVLAGRVRVLACSRPEQREALRAVLDRLEITHEWAPSPESAAAACARHRFEVALIDAGLPDADAVVRALDLRGRRLHRSVVVFGDSNGRQGFARLDAEPLGLDDAGDTVLGLLRAADSVTTG